MLTEAQSNFINSTAKFIRLLAPAGCGKTFSIVEKTKNILKTNPKAKINVFTFTRNAGQEIKEKCGKTTDILSVNTLNSWGNNYVKTTVLKNAKIISSPKERKFCVLNYLQPVWSKKEYEVFKNLLTGRSKVRQSDRILNLIDEFKNIGFKHFNFNKDVKNNTKHYYEHLNFINNVKLDRYYDILLQELAETIKRAFKNKDELHSFVIRHWIPFYHDCCEQMILSGIYTLDDQKYFANNELEKKLKKGERWTGTAKIDYIFIDEFQDTSPLDLMLISNLQKINNSALIIVGDDDQAIYEFRGAAPYFILHPDEIFGSTFETFILDKNFRSPANIVQKSKMLISHNKNRIAKAVDAQSGMPWAEIVYLNTSSEQIVNKVVETVKETLLNTNDNIVILSRLKASLLPYQVLLTKDNIDYSVSDDLAFFYTNAAQNLNRVLEIKRTNKELGPAELLELICLYSRTEIYPQAKDLLGRALVLNRASLENIYKILWLLGTKNPAFEKLFTEKFIVDFNCALAAFVKAKTVYDTLNCLLNEFEGLKQNYSRSLEDLYYRDPPLASLLDFAGQYGKDFNGFCEDFNRAISKTIYEKENVDILLEQSKPRVVLSTALRVKGQEFDKVIILNANDGVWPKTRSSTTKEDIEAERRLFYVAVTRVKHTLYFASGKEVISPFIPEGHFWPNNGLYKDDNKTIDPKLARDFDGKMEAEQNKKKQKVIKTRKKKR